MTDHPILFSAPMVRALLAGTKTQTRRIVKPQFPADAVVAEVSAVTAEGWQTSGHSGLWWDDAGACYDDAHTACPETRYGYGRLGHHTRKTRKRFFIEQKWKRKKAFRFGAGHGNPVSTCPVLPAGSRSK